MVDTKDSVERIEHYEDDSDERMSIREEARGDELPPGYFFSLQFIGTVLVSTSFLKDIIRTYLLSEN